MSAHIKYTIEFLKSLNPIYNDDNDDLTICDDALDPEMNLNAHDKLVNNK